MENIIEIPNVPCDDRIGSIFNHLFHLMHATESVECNKVIWDFQHVRFLHPFFLFPFSIYKNSCEKVV